MSDDTRHDLRPGVETRVAGQRYPGYDVLAKRDTPSWNDATRRAVAARLAVSRTPRFLGAAEFRCLEALCDRVTPQETKGADAIPVAALIDHKLTLGQRDGYRSASMPPEGQAWRFGLQALDAEAKARSSRSFAELSANEQDDLIRAMENGDLHHDAWQGMPSAAFFRERVLPDVTHAYYSHPRAWSEVGWGGPASPRGYVRMGFDRRDPWEPVELPAGAGAEDAERVRGANRRVR